MQVLPYRFAIVVSELTGRLVWPKSRSEQRTAWARFGEPKPGTFRIDIEWSALRQKNWKHRKLVFAALRRYLELPRVPKRKRLVLVWSDDDYWLADRQVLQAMKAWEPSDEPRRLWDEIKGEAYDEGQVPDRGNQARE